MELAKKATIYLILFIMFFNLMPLNINNTAYASGDSGISKREAGIGLVVYVGLSYLLGRSFSNDVVVQEDVLENFHKIEGSGIPADGYHFARVENISLEDAAKYALENELIRSFNYVKSQRRADFHVRTADEDELIDNYSNNPDYYELLIPQEPNFVDDYEQEVLRLTNQEREARGLETLELNQSLTRVARIKSEDMRDNNYYSHDSPTYGSPFDMISHYDISYRMAAENIHMTPLTPEKAVQDWMDSEGHRANILNSSFTEIGIGFAYDEDGTTYWTQLFIKD